MRRLLRASLGGAVAGFVLLGCGSQQDNGAGAPPFQAIAPTVARSALVPAGPTRIAVRWTGTHPGTVTISAVSAVVRLTRLMNELPQEGPGTCAEGLITGPPVVSFAFENAGGRTLARARAVDSTQYPVAWCVPTTFTLSGHRPVQLEGGGFFLRQVQRAVGQRLGATRSTTGGGQAAAH